MNTKSLAERLHLVSGEAENTNEGNYKDYFTADETIIVDDGYSNLEDKTEAKEALSKEETKTTVEQTVEPIPELTKEPVLYQPKEEAVSATNIEKAVEVQKQVVNNQQYVTHETFYDFREDDIARIIKVYERYNELSDLVKKIIRKFVGIEDQTANVSTIIYGIININDNDVTGLAKLIELKEQERTERAFSLVSLDDFTLDNISSLIISFNGNYKQEYSLIDNKIKFCQLLERGIEGIPTQSLSVIKPLEELLAIAKE